MIIVEIVGGLGNQLFEYAHARNLSIKYNLPLKLDISFFKSYKYQDVYRLDKFNICENVATENEIKTVKRVQVKSFPVKIVSKLFNTGVYKNNNYHVDELTLKRDKKKLINPKELYLSGYWQSENYFKENAKTIHKEFLLKKELNEENKKYLNTIKKNNSVSIHIRRGDYVNNSFFVNVPISFYKKAVDLIKDKVANPVFFFFSDDLDWVKQNIHVDSPHYYVDINDSKTDYFDLVLMSSCRHNIIANSSFSWWGAWLNNNPDKIIISPKYWFTNKKMQDYCEVNYLPKQWIRF